MELVVVFVFYAAILWALWQDLGKGLRSMLILLLVIIGLMAISQIENIMKGTKMIANKEIWTVCLGISIILCGVIKALVTAKNPYWSGKRFSELNQFESSEKFIVRFAYDFIGGLTNLPYLICIVLPVSLMVYAAYSLFVE